MSSKQTIAALKRCSLKASSSSDGRTAAGAVREADAELQRLGHAPHYALWMAKTAAKVGAAIRLVEARNT